MLSSRRLIGLVASFAVLTACSEAPTDPQPIDSDMLAPGFDFTNGPPTAGVVVRTAGSSFILFVNGDGSMVALGGLGSLDPNDSPICGGGSDFDVQALQNIVNPSGVVSELVRARGTWHVWADAATFFSQPSPCASVNLPRLAEGFGQATAFDNDLAASGTRTNTFGLRGQGTLDDLVNGGTTQFNLRFLAQIGKKGFKSIQQEITLH